MRVWQFGYNRTQRAFTHLSLFSAYMASHQVRKIITLRFLILGCKYVTGNFLYFSFSPPIGYLIWAVMGFCNVFENWASKKKSGHTGRFFIERKGFENIHVATSLIVKIPLDTIWSCTSSIMLKWLQRGLWMILDCLFFLVSCCRLQWLT